MKKENEINACNALIRILERVAGVKYQCDCFPDEELSKDREPDFILKPTCSGMTRMAVESAPDNDHASAQAPPTPPDSQTNVSAQRAARQPCGCPDGYI